MKSNTDDITRRFVKSYYKLVGIERVKTKKEFCEMIKTAPSNFKCMEDGKRYATVENLYYLHVIYEVSLGWLFKGEGEFIDKPL